MSTSVGLKQCLNQNNKEEIENLLPCCSDLIRCSYWGASLCTEISKQPNCMSGCFVYTGKIQRVKNIGIWRCDTKASPVVEQGKVG